MPKPIDPVARQPAGAARITSLVLDLGSDAHGRQVTAEATTLRSTGVRSWGIVVHAANQLDADQRVAGLSPEMIAKLAHAITTIP